MATNTLQEQARALGDPTRHAIFRHLATAREPSSIAELSSLFPFNHNAIRQHLAKLVAAGLVVERTAPARGPGRPRLLYAVDPAAAGQWGTVGPYERLSRLLVEIIRTGLTPEEVGRRAAPSFVDEPSGDPVADLTGAMARQGFDPEARPVGAGTEVVLHTCPFANVAAADRDTVCALHLGIAEGIAALSDARVDELIGYDPRLADCRVRLGNGEDGSAPGAPGVLTLRRTRRRPRTDS
jgi:predicted ArsR family transcriptional regulator